MNAPYFDAFSKDYVALHKASLGFIGSRREYFGAHKAAVTAAALSTPPARVLEFGCGVGSNLPHLQAVFPEASLFGCDVSTASLAEAKRVAPEVSFFDVTQAYDLQQWAGSFDLIFVANVFHHIAPQEWDLWLRQLAQALQPQGRLAFFEHNPFNPFTRYMVSRCPFDADAHLLSQGQIKRLLQQAGLCINKAKYIYPFPFFPRVARLTDRMLFWLPLGFQYFLLASALGEA